MYVKCQEQASRVASPTAAIIDAQSVKGAEKGGARVALHGYDAGKKVKGKSVLQTHTEGEFVMNTLIVARHWVSEQARSAR